MRRKLFQILSFIFLLSFLSSILSGAVNDTLLNGLRIETKIQYGFIYPHHKSIEYLLDGNIKSYEIGLSTESTGRNFCEDLYRYPRYGLTYNFTDFSNPAILGYAQALFGYIDIPLSRRNGKTLFCYQIAGGVSYISKRYNPETNPLNLAISSALDVYIGFDFSTRIKISDKNELKTGIELTHFSNGKWRSPNLGLNMITLSAAWSYSIIPAFKPVTPIYSNKTKRSYTDIILNIGVKRDDLLNEKLYTVNTIIVDYYYGFLNKYAFGGGIDFFCDPSLIPVREYEQKVKANSSDKYQSGIHVGALARYGRMSVVINAGAYSFANFYKYSRVYSRLGMRYAITDNIVANFSIKAHYAIADYLEWGIGYRFNSKMR